MPPTLLGRVRARNRPQTRFLAQTTVNPRGHHAKDGPAVTEVELRARDGKQEDTHTKHLDMSSEADGPVGQELDSADQIIQHVPPTQQIDFVTLGMFIIDDIEFLLPKPPAHNILGGAGTYSALGARLFSPPPLSQTVGWIVDQGSDFPHHLTDQINAWQTSALIRRNPSRLTTRGWNGYDAAERRAFRYATPKRRLTADDLTPPLLQAKAIHLICSPLRCQELVNSLLARRREAFLASKRDAGGSDADAEAEYTRPLIIWEPVPDLCVPGELLNCTNTLPLVDVCSPNHAELASFMGDDKGAANPTTGRPDPAAVERYSEQLLSSMPLQSYTLVVRAGEAGCYVARNGGRRKKMVGSSNHNDNNNNSSSSSSRKKKTPLLKEHGLRPDMDLEALFANLLRDEDGCVAREEIEMDPGLGRWLPAYYGTGYQGDASEKVVDPTGGGNTFLGGLAVALARGKTMEEACAWGHVAASFAIEQVGFPVLSVDEEGREVWNGVRVEERLAEYRERVQL
ncbi:hypothetical protein VTJ49DRAFT_4657 [Mycothermus thermophilus]|uniref:Carbohydrate kinase PfkB domain-containing protein n=1 Tax=Humicola insolens TaxID=85995 RepID=A0ABR3VL29_HUMIN